MKKLLSILLAVVLIFVVSFSVFAETPYSSDFNKIIIALQSVEPIKSEMGLSFVDFSKIKVGRKINTYNFSSEGFVISRVIYPLIYNDELVALAIQIDNSQNSDYQITTSLVQEIKQNISFSTKFALLYDKQYCYLYTGEAPILLIESSIISQDRLDLQAYNNIADYSSLQLNNIGDGLQLNYVSNTASRIQTYYSCNVSFVSQNPPSSICWAASIACIVNYLKGTNYTAVRVARNHYGSNYNRGLPEGEEDDVLRNEYSVSYTYRRAQLNENVILRNIQSGYPIFAGFSNGDNFHAVVVYGVNIMSGYFYVMDPQFGTTSVNSTTRTYVSSYANVAITQYDATCKYWST